MRASEEEADESEDKEEEVSEEEEEEDAVEGARVISLGSRQMIRNLQTASE